MTETDLLQPALTISGASCGGCVRKIQQALAPMTGDPEQVRVDLQTQTVYLPPGLDLAEAARRVSAAGFPARLRSEPAPSCCRSRSSAAGTDHIPQQEHPRPESADADADTISLAISGATCASCVRAIEQAMLSVPGVREAHMNLATQVATATGEADAQALAAAIESAGYGAEPIVDPEQADARRQQQERRRYHRLLVQMAISLSLGLGLMIWGMGAGNMMVTPANQQAWLVLGLLTLLVMAATGGHYYSGAFKAFRHHNANMDTLIALGTGTAWLYSMVVVLIPEALPELARHVYFEASAMIIGLINLGQALELRAKGKTSAAVRRLLDLRPATARVIRDGQEQDLPVAQVRPGDHIRIRPGDRVPVDGVILEGETHIDESMLTGEPMPVARSVGDAVAAGTLNTRGSVICKATRVGRDTALARIVELVKKAQGSKPAIGRLADRVAAVFVPAVMLVAVLSALIWYNFGPEPRVVHMLVAATTVLIIACPCALGLATPMSVMVGVGKAAQYGALIRQGDALQTAGQVDLVILDKTGTLTLGKPAVTCLHAVNGDEQEVLALAAGLEQHSPHPLAAAVLEKARQSGIEPVRVSDFEAFSGRGVRATLNGEVLRLGNRRWLETEGLSVAAVEDAARNIIAAAGTPLFLARGKQVLGVIGVSDALRPDARAAVERLHRAGIRVMILTGDIDATARIIARQAGIDDYRAEVLPKDKADMVYEMRHKGYTVAMVGDGINDAPALAAADVGFAIGSGTDVAIESAPVTLLRNSLHAVPDAIEISRATVRNIRQNLFGAFIYNLLGIPVAAGLLYPIWGVLLNPVLAGAAMSLSSVTVVTNANRLRLFKTSQPQVSAEERN